MNISTSHDKASKYFPNRWNVHVHICVMEEDDDNYNIYPHDMCGDITLTYSSKWKATIIASLLGRVKTWSC